jgi:hypothetical protein
MKTTFETDRLTFGLCKFITTLLDPLKNRDVNKSLTFCYKNTLLLYVMVSV